MNWPSNWLWRLRNVIQNGVFQSKRLSFTNLVHTTLRCIAQDRSTDTLFRWLDKCRHFDNSRRGKPLKESKTRSEESTTRTKTTRKFNNHPHKNAKTDEKRWKNYRAWIYCFTLLFDQFILLLFHKCPNK